MNKETLKALKGSIKKWEKIVDGKITDLGPRNCPLCKLFYKKECNTKCPVGLETLDGCKAGDYYAWAMHHYYSHDDKSTVRVFKNCSRCKTLAMAELDLLKSILPKNK